MKFKQHRRFGFIALHAKRISRTPSAQKTLHTVAAMTLSLVTFQSALANVNLATAPVFLKESVDPNLMFIYDDSASMSRDYMPDTISNAFTLFFDNNGPFQWSAGFRVSAQNFWYYSNKVNLVYYNPDIEYRPPFNPDGSGRLANSDFNAAWRDGYTETGSIDLGTFYPADRYNGDFADSAFYYRFDTSVGCEADPRQNNCYTLIFLDEESDQQQQNFANWYSYYRTRTFASRAGISEAFFDLPQSIRLGYGALGSEDQDIDGEDMDTIISGVRPYTSARRTEFLTWLQGKETNLGFTPLRTSLEDAGEYYSRTDNEGPWGVTPGTNDTTPQIECRPSYTILMTDGVYNGNSPGVGNVDNASGPNHSRPGSAVVDYTYQAVSPFADDRSNTLADVAMKYWKTDLRPTLPNKVPTEGIDEAFWQHMTTFTIGLGVEGTVSESDAFAAINSGANITWPDPLDDINDTTDRIDDLLHAAVNGRGGFASAQNPDQFSREIEGFLDTVVARAETTASAAAVSSAVLRTESAGFFAGFRSTDWSGTLTGFNFNAGEQIWDAEEKLREADPATRNVLTHNGSNGVTLADIDDLSDDQRDALNANPEVENTPDNLGSERIDWIRGKTNVPDSFRSRTFTPEGEDPVLRLLGDIVNANPLFVGTPNFGYSRLPGDEGQTYGAYRSTGSYQNRAQAIYVAANDGMLHSFDSETGEELFAFMPGELLNPSAGSFYAQISSLMSPNYTHRYFMDGTPTSSDAYIDVNGDLGWKTVLVGSMGAGGRSVFAIDITDPDSVDSQDVIWEFSHPDLGFGVSDPQIARLPNGDWAAIFGNGYNGTDDAASLFVVNLEDGSLIKQIETGVGSSVSSNGLAAATLTNFPAKGAIANHAYAGDLAGNLWRFDLTGNDSTNWSAQKLFTATDPDGDNQPFTVAPRLTVNPSNLDELMISVGSGSFLRSDDDVDRQVQTLYTISDDLVRSELDRDDLTQQTITKQGSITVTRADASGDNEFTVRETSSNSLDGKPGWFIDLVFDGEKTGERVVSRANYPFGIFPDRVRFSTLIPDQNPCSSGRRGFIMDLKLVTGKAPEDPVFDLNSDGIFNDGDTISGDFEYAPAGIDVGEGAEIRTVAADDSEAFITDQFKIDKDEPCTSAFCGRALNNSIGRQSWEQLR
jgi:type IV pilus assembly protein PilY1